ncbi:MAG: hypothetical protein E7591_04535 [Ruminococcaceae bacterium]|nr:hypothetical protein [Oscillospiraceae bacterium]
MNSFEKKKQILLSIQKKAKILRGYWAVPVLFIIAVGFKHIMGLFSFGEKYIADSWPMRWIIIILCVLVSIWIISVAAAWLIGYYLKNMRKEAEQNKKDGNVKTKKKRASSGSTLMLSWFQRNKAKRNLKRLQDDSDYCFLTGRTSYIRLQNLHAGDERILKLDNNSRVSQKCIYKNFGDCMLTAEKVTDKKGFPHVYLYWTSVSPSKEEIRNAETVELEPDTPVALSYGLINENDNTEREAVVCVITWIEGGL